MGYFGTNEDLPNAISFSAGHWSGQYEAGKLRYLYLGNCEVLRMVYPAIRDQYWRTAPAEILSEELEIKEDSFYITYTARYQLETVDYQARYVLQGDAQGRISVEMWGEALSDFMRNRMGLCVLHPIESCMGKSVAIMHPDGKQTDNQFPTLISPHQPFFDVQGMHWSPAPGWQVQLHFEGEVFETEDQRNWTDSSYKTYGTPLSIPFPVQVQTGETLYQKLTLEYQAEPVLEMYTPTSEEIKVLEQVHPFPQLGTDWNNQVNADTPKLPLDFLHLLLNLEDPDCAPTLKEAAQTAQQLGIKIGLSVLMPEDYFLPPFVNTLHAIHTQIQHLCILGKPVPSTILMEEAYTAFKAAFPGLPIGYGTDGYFTDLNRHRPHTEAFDFVQFSFNPQVHAVDTRTLIENLSAQRDVVSTAQSFAHGKPIYVAPITLRGRYNPDPATRIDPRQHSEFAAAWMLLSLKYLAPCAALSYFEWMGEKGIFSAPDNTPLGSYLQQIAAFKPTLIVETSSSNPLKKDVLLLENAEGKLLGFEVDFETGEIAELN